MTNSNKLLKTCVRMHQRSEMLHLFCFFYLPVLWTLGISLRIPHILVWITKDMNCLVSDKDLTTNHAIVMKVYCKITTGNKIYDLTIDRIIIIGLRSNTIRNVYQLTNSRPPYLNNRNKIEPGIISMCLIIHGSQKEEFCVHILSFWDE